jgi:hypothetical protein
VACSAAVGPTSGQLHAHDPGQPSAAEQVVLERLNRARRDPGAEAARLGIALDEGTSPPLADGPRPPLTLHAGLLQAARAHSQDMLARDFFEHTNPDGEDPFDRMQAAGYAFAVAGENLHMAMASQPLDADTEAPGAHDDLFVDAGYPGRGHRRNLVDADFTEVGIGVATGDYRMNATTYDAMVVTQDFASPLGGPRHYLLGVVYHDRSGDGVYDAGEGLADVEVTASGDARWSTRTGAAGGYAFVIAQPGSVELQVAIPGDTRCLRVEVASSSVQVDLRVEP